MAPALKLMTWAGPAARVAARDIDSVLYVSYRRLVPPDGS
jgi:hypothetical protein